MFPCAATLTAFTLLTPAVQSDSAVQVSPWAVLGPFDCPGGDVRLETEVEKLVKRMQAGAPWPVFEGTFAGRGKARLAWRRTGSGELPAPGEGGVFATGAIDLAALVGVSGAAADNVSAYLYREIVAREACSFELSCGSDDGLRLWVNGELVLESTRPRGLQVMDEPFTLRLAAGTNHLLVKVASGVGAFAFAMTEPLPVAAGEVNAAIDRGVAWLLAQQLYDGSWAAHQDAYRSGQTALTLYTLLKSGVSPRHVAVQQALVQLESWPPERTYSIACEMFALAALHDPVHRGRLEKRVEQLLDEQHSDGGWAYPGDQTDLSITQYAALSLRAAAQEGVHVPNKVWLELIDYALDHQEGGRKKEAGFTYIPGHGTGYTGSMTTAGITVLAIGRAALGAAMPSNVKQATDAGIEAGLAWLARNWSVSSNPNKPDYHLYYLYGLERVGGLLDRPVIGGHDWYAEVSRHLVRTQEASGAWNNSETDTCFALLCLARATSPSSGVVRDPRLFATEPRPICLRVRVGTPARLWIDPPALGAGQVLERVEFLVRHARHEWERIGEADQNRALTFDFPGPGAYEVRAEAVLAGGQRLVSSVLAVTQDEGLGPEQRAAASEGARSRIALVNPRVRASSASATAANAVDGKSWTRWLCEASDADPWLEVELSKSQSAARLVLAHARTTRAENEGANPRPARVELLLGNEKVPRVIELDPDPRTRTVIDLDPPQKIARLRLRVVAATDGEPGAAALGFSEIELFEPDRKPGAKER